MSANIKVKTKQTPLSESIISDSSDGYSLELITLSTSFPDVP